MAGGPKAITSEGISVVMWGQSIFDHVKILFRNLNKLRSITATQAHLLANRPTEAIYEDGTPWYEYHYIFGILHNLNGPAAKRFYGNGITETEFCCFGCSVYFK